jgi:hypothetical protein
METRKEVTQFTPSALEFESREMHHGSRTFMSPLDHKLTEAALLSVAAILTVDLYV